MESSYNIHHMGHLGPMGNPYTRCRSNRSVAFSPAYKRKNASIWLHNVNRRFREKVPLEQWKNISLYSIKCINETFYRKKIQKIHDFRTPLHTGHNWGKYRKKTTIYLHNYLRFCMFRYVVMCSTFDACQTNNNHNGTGCLNKTV